MYTLKKFFMGLVIISGILLLVTDQIYLRNNNVAINRYQNWIVVFFVAANGFIFLAVITIIIRSLLKSSIDKKISFKKETRLIFMGLFGLGYLIFWYKRINSDSFLIVYICSLIINSFLLLVSINEKDISSQQRLPKDAVED
jgi:hypothetical protein